MPNRWWVETGHFCHIYREQQNPQGHQSRWPVNTVTPGERDQLERNQTLPATMVSIMAIGVSVATSLRRNICALHLLRSICYMVARGPRCPAEGSFSGWVLPVRRRYWALRGGSQLAHGHVQCVSLRNPRPPFGSS